MNENDIYVDTQFMIMSFKRFDNEVILLLGDIINYVDSFY